MKVKADFWLDSEVGELDIEIIADVFRGDSDGPYIFRGESVEIDHVYLVEGKNKIDITNKVLGTPKVLEICVERILDTYDEAKFEAQNYRRLNYRHVDLHA